MSNASIVRGFHSRTLHYIRKLGFKTGFLAGNTDYNRFIVLGRSRVGSNLLRGLLNSHSEIVAFGELFQNQDEIGWAFPGNRESEVTRSRFINDPVSFLDKDVFIRFPLDITAVGFKIFYYRAQQEEWQPVWSYLRGHTEIKVIHIKRRNILKTHLSRKRAMLTNEWFDTSQVQAMDKPMTLDYDECVQDFVSTRESEAQYDAFFNDHDKIDIVYERLAADYPKEMGLIQSFLGVEREGLVPETHKQSHLPMSQAIVNYFELKEQFSGSPWIEFFNE